MIDRELKAISLQDLQELKENAVRESRTLDYKQSLACQTREERKEFLANITAFANTAGGDLVVGVAEEQGEPVSFPGIEIPDFDEFERRLLSIVRDGTEPRLQGVSLARVPVEHERYVVIVRVPRSYARPHRVIFSGHGHFYGRDSSQKYRLDVEDLRRAFTLTAAKSEFTQRFLLERVEAIQASDGFAPIDGKHRAVLHLISEAALAGEGEVDLSEVPWSELRPLPRAAMGFSNGYSLEGIFCYNEWAYTALLRNGVIEAVERLHEHKNTVFPTQLQADVIAGTRAYLALMKQLEIKLPVQPFLTLIGMKGCSFPTWSIDALRGRFAPVQQETIQLNGPAIGAYDVDVPTALRPMFDRLWNAFGYPRCLDYDDAGEWRPRERAPLA